MASTYTYFDVTGGSQSLGSYGYTDVSRYSASSFYNWEQDNLPISDLDTNSKLLLEQLGLNTALTGVILTVSSTGDLSLSSQGIFQTVQSALRVVPTKLNFPILIEVCTFGNLGDIELNNIQCVGNGALQIQFRQYAEDYSATPISVSASTAYGPSISQTLPVQLSATQFPSQISQASSTKLATSCSSVSLWNKHARMFYAKLADSQSENQLLGFTQFPARSMSTQFSAGASSFTTEAYDSSYDISVSADVNPKTLNGTGTALLSERRALLTTDKVTAVAYGTYFNSIKITKCNNVKLKNICIDSASGVDFRAPKNLTHLRSVGLDVLDSNILLENVAVCRSINVGVKSENSVISSRGHLIVYRIYNRNSIGDRNSEGTGIFLSDSVLAFNTSGYSNGGAGLVNISKCGIGLDCVNSRIADGVINSSSSKNAGGTDTQTTRILVHSNITGVKLSNSVIDFDGRFDVFCNTTGMALYQSTLNLYQFSIDDNEKYGIDLNKSVLIYGKKSSTNGIAAFSGTVKPAYSCDYNGINLNIAKGSTVKYADDCVFVSALGLWGGSFSGSNTTTAFQTMASHGLGVGASPAILVSDNSNAEFVNLSVATKGTTACNAGACVRAERSSSVVFRGTQNSHTCLGSYGTYTSDKKSNWTIAAVAAIDNSQVTFTGPTKIGKVGINVLADSNSKISFGPASDDFYSWIPDITKYSLQSSSNHTMVDLHSTRACLVAHDKSTIEMISLGGSATAASTSVNANANFSLSGLFMSATSGSYMRFSPNAFADVTAIDTFIGGDSFQLFNRSVSAFSDASHNAVTTGGMCVRAVGSSKVNIDSVNFKMDGGLASQLSGAFYNVNGTGAEFLPASATSYGGISSMTSNLCQILKTVMCSSTTTFTTTETSPQTSLPFLFPPFNPDGLQDPLNNGNQFLFANYPIGQVSSLSAWGSRIHMWNIADTSRIHASNLLINKLNPATACTNNIFHGPTGRWLNGAACDYYGKFGFAASSISSTVAGAADGFYNLGIFRIVGSHRGYLKRYTQIDWRGTLQYLAWSGGGDPIDQINSQGYQTMYDIAIDSSGARDTVSYHVGLEPGLTKYAEPIFGRGLPGLPGAPGKMNGVITHARMHEGSGMLWDAGQLHPVFPVPPLHVDWQGYIRNWLDESAASVFANARHGANKKVNLVSIYRSTTSIAGGEGRDKVANNAYATFGWGVRSLNLFDLNKLL